MPNFTITAMGRDDAVTYCRQSHGRKSIIISLSTPLLEYYSEPFITQQNNVKAILRLEFNDADTGPDIMTKYDAERIKKFLQKFMVKYPGLHIVVHCDAGQSRSAGVAGAILKHYTGDDSQIFNNPRYRPNMHCYRMLLNKLQEEDSTP